MIWLVLVLLGGCNSKRSEQHNAMEGHSSHTATLKPDTGHQKHRNDTLAGEIYWNTLPTNATVLSSQKAIEPEESTIDFPINGTGYITFDYRRNRKIPVRVSGRLERLYVKYNYQYIRKGEKIFEIYSPEINTYIEELLYVKHQTTDTILQNNAKQKLLLLGLTPTQIKQIERSAQPPPAIGIYSPFEGYALFNTSASGGMQAEKNGTANDMSAMSNEKKGSLDISSAPLTDNSIREGMYAGKEQTLFWINDFKEVWGILAFTTENEKYIRKGLPVTVTSELLPDKSFQTSIQLVEQVYQEGQKFTQARVYLPNASGLLKQNSLITATLSMPVRSLVIPTSSVHYLGKVAIVWVRTGVTKEGSNVFKSRVVRIGHRDNDNVEILEGLKKGEWVAKDAAYLADGESIINY